MKPTYRYFTDGIPVPSAGYYIVDGAIQDRRGRHPVVANLEIKEGGEIVMHETEGWSFHPNVKSATEYSRKDFFRLLTRKYKESLSKK